MSLNSENGTQLTMPVMPACGIGGYGMGGFGGDGWWGILFLIAIMCGGWGGFGGFGGMNGLMGMWPFMFGGFGGNSASVQGALTRGELCQDMNFQDVKNGVSATKGAVDQGFSNLNSTICHQQYDTARLVDGLGMNVMQGFSQAELAETQRQAALMQQLYQMGYNQQDCCCRTQSSIERINYDAAMRGSTTERLIERGFCDTIQAGHNDADRVLAKLDAMEMARKDETIMALREKLSRADLAASQAAQNTYLVDQLRPCPQPAYLTCNPFTGQTYAYGQYGNGCGCNSGCCGCNG